MSAGSIAAVLPMLITLASAPETTRNRIDFALKLGESANNLLIDAMLSLNCRALNLHRKKTRHHSRPTRASSICLPAIALRESVATGPEAACW